jgi:hypothetical protein
MLVCLAPFDRRPSSWLDDGLDNFLTYLLHSITILHRESLAPVRQRTFGIFNREPNRNPVTQGEPNKIFAAADVILRGGRRPTIEAIQTLLGGGSPNSVVTYLNDWYADLARRLAATEVPALGLSPEVHRAARQLQAAVARQASGDLDTKTSDILIRSLRAEALSLQTLLNELRAQRARDQQLLADAEALLVTKDEELREVRADQLALRSGLAIALDRQRRRTTASSRSSKHSCTKTVPHSRAPPPKRGRGTAPTTRPRETEWPPPRVLGQKGTRAGPRTSAHPAKIGFPSKAGA